MPERSELIERTGRLDSQRSYGDTYLGHLDDGTEFRLEPNAPDLLHAYQGFNIGDVITIWGLPEGDERFPRILVSEVAFFGR